MSKSSEVREMIRQVLSDGVEHNLSELYAESVRREIIPPEQRSIVRAAIDFMKRHGELQVITPGLYRLRQGEAAQTEEESPRSGELDLEELREFSRRVGQTCRRLKRFNWIQCSDEELREAREKAQLLRQLQAQIQALDVLGGG